MLQTACWFEPNALNLFVRTSAARSRQHALPGQGSPALSRALSFATETRFRLTNFLVPPQADDAHRGTAQTGKARSKRLIPTAICPAPAFNPHRPQAVAPEPAAPPEINCPRLRALALLRRWPIVRVVSAPRPASEKPAQ